MRRNDVYHARAARFVARNNVIAKRKARARRAKTGRGLAWAGLTLGAALAGFAIGGAYALNETNGTKGNKMFDIAQSELAAVEAVIGETGDDYVIACYGDAGARAFPVCGLVVRETLHGVTLLDVSDGWFEAYAVQVDGVAAPWVFDDFEVALDFYYDQAKLGEPD